MANFNRTSVHCVETVRARVLPISDAICLTLEMSGRNDFGETEEAEVDVFFPAGHEAHVRALADAINAVPALAEAENV